MNTFAASYKPDFKRNYFVNWLHHWFYPGNVKIPGTFGVTDDFGNAIAVDVHRCTYSLYPGNGSKL